MKVYGSARTTCAETIRRFGALGDRGGSSEAAAEAWTAAGFDDKSTARWLSVRCFDPRAAGALAKLGLDPAAVTVRTRDGGGYLDTIGYKVANGDLTPRQAAARALSSR